MGTRATVSFYEDDKSLATIYYQYDGYIQGVGYDLANFLLNKKVINGYSSDQTAEGGYANGIGCLAAQYIAKFKTGIGEMYITENGQEELYHYIVKWIDGKFEITVDKFIGTPEELLSYTG